MEIKLSIDENDIGRRAGEDGVSLEENLVKIKSIVDEAVHTMYFHERTFMRVGKGALTEYFVTRTFFETLEVYRPIEKIFHSIHTKIIEEPYLLEPLQELKEKCMEVLSTLKHNLPRTQAYQRRFGMGDKENELREQEMKRRESLTRDESILLKEALDQDEQNKRNKIYTEVRHGLYDMQMIFMEHFYHIIQKEAT